MPGFPSVEYKSAYSSSFIAQRAGHQSTDIHHSLSTTSAQSVLFLLALTMAVVFSDTFLPPPISYTFPVCQQYLLKSRSPNANAVRFARSERREIFVFFSRFSPYSRNSRLTQAASIESRQDFKKALRLRFSNSKYDTGLGIVQQEKEPPSLQSGRYGGWGSRQACGN